MEVVVYTMYGTQDILQIKEIEKPYARNDAVLIKVCTVEAS